MHKTNINSVNIEEVYNACVFNKYSVVYSFLYSDNTDQISYEVLNNMFSYAVYFSSNDIFKLLVEYNSSYVTYEFLHIAHSHKNYELVEFMLDNTDVDPSINNNTILNDYIVLENYNMFNKILQDERVVDKISLINIRVAEIYHQKEFVYKMLSYTSVIKKISFSLQSNMNYTYEYLLKKFECNTYEELKKIINFL